MNKLVVAGPHLAPLEQEISSYGNAYEDIPAAFFGVSAACSLVTALVQAA